MLSKAIDSSPGSAHHAIFLGYATQAAGTYTRTRFVVCGASPMATRLSDYLGINRRVRMSEVTFARLNGLKGGRTGRTDKDQKRAQAEAQPLRHGRQVIML